MAQEAKLCAAVFPSGDQTAAALAQVATPAAGALLEAAAGVLAAKRAPEKIFVCLEMHQAVEGVLPTLRAAGSRPLDRVSVALARVSPGPGGAGPPGGPSQQLAVAEELASLRLRLVGEARACFTELQQTVGAEAGTAAPADATVHPLCASTVTTFKRVLAFDAALSLLFGEGENAVRGGG